MKLFSPLMFLLLFNLMLQAQLPVEIKNLYDKLDNYTSAARLANYYDATGQFDSVKKFADLVLDIPDSENSIQEIEAQNHLTKYYIIYGEYNLAKAYNLKSIESSQKQSDISHLAKAYLYQGLVFDYLGELSDAELAYRKSLRIYIDAGDTKNAATVYLNLGVLDKFRGDYGKAVENYQEALLIYELENDTHNIGKVLNNIGNVYYNLEQDYEQALKYYEQALQMFSFLTSALFRVTLCTPCYY